MTNLKLGKRLYAELLRIYPNKVMLTELRERFIGTAYFHCSRKRILKILFAWEELRVVRVKEMKRRPNEYMIRFDPSWVFDRVEGRPMGVRELQAQKLIMIKRRLSR